MTYVMSDIHGQYDAFLDILQKIKFSNEDKLYILGDIVDRGNKSFEIYEYILSHKNIELIMGNHEKMIVDYAKSVGYDIKNQQKRFLTKHSFNCFHIWMGNGGTTTFKQLKEKPSEIIEDFINDLSELPYYKKVEINNKKYFLCHSKPIFYNGFSFNESIEENIKNEDIIWNRDLYDEIIPENYIIIHGHTPVYYQNRGEENMEDLIYYYPSKNIINIDCGCAGKRKLGCMRLEDEEEFYSNKME